MAEIKITFDLTFTRRFMTAALAVAVMLCAVPELDSESVTLSTYYPAPSGVYTNMITTGNTFLARDGGNVGIGTVAPGAKLDIAGSLTASGAATFNNSVTGTYGMTPGYVSWATYGTGAGGAAIYNDAGAYVGLMLVGNNSGGGGIRRVKVWDELTTNGNTITTGSSFTSGAITSTQACGAPQTLIYSTPGGGTTGLCGGQYVTTISGMYTKYNLLPLDRGPNLTPPINPTANYICCPCPSTGCTL